MLYRLHRLAVRLHPCKQAVAAAGLLFIVLAAVALVVSEDSDVLLRLAILGTLWAGLLYSGIELFRDIPRAPARHDRLLRRLGLKLRRLFHSLLAALIVLFTLMLLWMSVRLAFL